MNTPKLICIIGAESTGKTTLARQLASHFGCPWVPEYLREFCDSHQRTPHQNEQSLILETQLMHERAALQRARVDDRRYVFCDTAPLLTAIYSEFVFADTSLYARTRALHARYALTLLLATDVAWAADGIQRDGEHVRDPITKKIGQELTLMDAPFTRVSGIGDSRLPAAIRAITAA